MHRESGSHEDARHWLHTVTESTGLVALDPRVADLLAVPVPVTREALARSIAEQAGFTEPATPLLIEFWVKLAACIEAELVRMGFTVREDGEAAHEVRSCLYHQLDGAERALDELRWRSLDDALEPWLMWDVVTGMAARGAYRLVDGPAIRPRD